MTKKIFLFASFFMFGSVFALEDLYLRVNSDYKYMFCCVYEHTSEDGEEAEKHTSPEIIFSDPDVNNGFVKIERCFEEGVLRRIHVQGLCESRGYDTYEHEARELWACGDGCDVIILRIYNPTRYDVGMNSNSRKKKWRCIIKLCEHDIKKIAKLGNVCQLKLDGGYTLVGPTATFEIRPDSLPIEEEVVEKTEQKVDKSDWLHDSFTSEKESEELLDPDGVSNEEKIDDYY